MLAHLLQSHRGRNSVTRRFELAPIFLEIPEDIDKMNTGAKLAIDFEGEIARLSRVRIRQRTTDAMADQLGKNLGQLEFCQHRPFSGRQREESSDDVCIELAVVRPHRKRKEFLCKQLGKVDIRFNSERACCLFRQKPLEPPRPK